MKILIVLENYLPHIGGVELVFKNLISGLVKQGHDITVLTQRLPHTKKEEIINGAKIIRIRCFGSRYLFSFFAIPKAIKLAKEADIIHTTTFNGAPPAWVASKIRKKPLLLTVHEVWINRWRELTDLSPLTAWLHDKLERLIYILKYDHYACVSASSQSHLLERNIPKEKTSVVYNGLDYNLWNPRKYSKPKLREKFGWKTFTYLCSGRPGVSKGIEYAVKAAAKIAEHLPESKFVLLLSKDSAYQTRYHMIKALIKELDLKDNMILIDPVPYDKLPEYIMAADCVVIPSISEGFGFAAAEASALGTPVVASNTTSLPEVISNKYLLVKKRSPHDIATAVIAVHDNNFKTSPLKKFTWEDNVEKYLNIYKKLIN
jgi:glycosyltransferase involved in cell wall biosynthesis